MEIKVGFDTNGDIYADLEEVKACNICAHFKGYGLHACTGHCFKLNKDIDGGYTGNYSKVAKECNDFDVRPELIKKQEMNKICTDINQSQKLMGLGIDIDTADMYYDVNSYGTQSKPEVAVGKVWSKDIPAWSLTVLFKMLPYSARLERGSSTELYCVTLPNELKSSDWYLDPIDAAFEMICWLKENEKI